MMKNTQSHRAIAYLGGTFDPVHYGHLRLAEALADQLQLNVVNLLPCHIPPHKATPKVDTRTRSKMLQLATQDNPTLRIDERELKRNKPSYTTPGSRGSPHRALAQPGAGQSRSPAHSRRKPHRAGNLDA